VNALAEHRSWEWNLLDPLVGSSMLELGNKRKSAKNGGAFVYKTVFESLGFRHVSVDMNGLDGALPKDLRKPLGLGTFDMVTNIGTSEHVSEDNWSGQIACWRNMLEAMHVGSVLVSITPRPGHWVRHGTWYPKPEFFEELARLNGCEVERGYQNETPNLALVFARLRRVEDVPFAMPNNGMFKNR
jgi:hypothetical protein